MSTGPLRLPGGRPALVALVALVALAALAAFPRAAHANAGPRAHGPLTAEQRERFLASAPDEAPPRLSHGAHYLTSNEYRQDLFRPVIDNLGGGYVGVGSDQALLFLGWQRPTFAWLIDYDDEVVAVNEVHWKLLAAAPTAAGFLRLWAPESRDESLRIVTAGLTPAAARRLRNALRDGRPAFLARVRLLERRIAEHGVSCFLNDPAQYDFLRGLAHEGRVRSMVGNLVGDRALPGIGAAASSLGVTIRVVYLSNAEQYFRYRRTYRTGLSALPYDDASVILRTFPILPLSSSRYYYNVQPAKNLVAWLEKPSAGNVYGVLRYRTPYRLKEDLVEELTRVDRLPGAPAPSPLPSPPRRRPAALVDELAP